MGERTVMGTTDVSVLTLRIQELEKENARLKAILDKEPSSQTVFPHTVK